MNTIPIPRPEHPNPQFQRADWLNLNGEWEFEIDHAASGTERKLWAATRLSGKIVVPFCPESALSGVENTDFMACVWYRRVFTVPAEHSGKQVIIHFGASDYETTVYINGHRAGMHRGGYTPFSFDISPLLHGELNTVTVCALDDTRSKVIPSGKQSERYESHGCFYTRTTGIWQTVWLEFLPKNRIESVKYYPNPAETSLAIHAQVLGQGEFTAEAFYEGESVGKVSAIARGGYADVVLNLSKKHLWEPGNGRLYNLILTFENDSVRSYFGLRDVCLDGRRFLINDISVFQRLVLDQGFYPDGIYTAATDEDLVRDIELSFAAGFNGARLHEKVFEPRFLYHCDRLGYLVWGEYPNWGVDHADTEVLYRLLPEWCEEVDRDFNHPAIIGWCPFNETWDYLGRRQRDDLLKIVYQTTKRMDPTRPCIDTSGNYHVVTDIYDVHDYDQNPVTFKEHYDCLSDDDILYDAVCEREKNLRQTYNGEPVFVSEYGGIQWSVGSDEGWGYGNAPKSPEEFFARYKGLTDALLDNAAIFGFCYTQLYDVEQEQNGLYTYARQPKFDMENFKAVNIRKAAIE